MIVRTIYVVALCDGDECDEEREEDFDFELEVDDGGVLWATGVIQRFESIGWSEVGGEEQWKLLCPACATETDPVAAAVGEGETP